VHDGAFEHAGCGLTGHAGAGLPGRPPVPGSQPRESTPIPAPCGPADTPYPRPTRAQASVSRYPAPGHPAPRTHNDHTTATSAQAGAA
jgi:hypothetical protein